MVQRARPDRVYGSQSSPQRARPGGLECHDLKPFRVLIFPAQRVDPVQPHEHGDINALKGFR